MRMSPITRYVPARKYDGQGTLEYPGAATTLWVFNVKYHNNTIEVLIDSGESINIADLVVLTED